MLKRILSVCAVFTVCLCFCLNIQFGMTVKATDNAYMSGEVTIDGTESLTGSNRIFRDGVSSTIENPKIFPGTFESGIYYYSVIDIMEASADPYNVQVDFHPIDSNIFCAAYTDAFDPQNLETNYLADVGYSSTVSFSFTVPSGKKLLLVFSNVDSSIAQTSAEYEVELLTKPAFEVDIQSDDNGTAEADLQSAKAALGDIVELTATPDENYHFLRWEVITPSDLVIEDNKFTMPAENVSIKAIFEKDPQALEAISVTPPSKTTYTEGDKLDLEGLAVTAKYNYGDDKIVTDYVASPSDESILNTDINKVIISYTENEITKTAEFEINVEKKPEPPKEEPEIPDTGNDTASMYFYLLASSLAVVFIVSSKKRKAVNK